ncbi:hypothetical protein CSUI_000280 [Cystoisospora suis]|uniref:RRM domain-containing protein n=1 Tax=Cystoisospora suis TaxID=483139 RepID=A0A2C6LHG4_9APIC|nr:hypothetical protein CSUI_000280 [Cystoisospora suis]
MDAKLSRKATVEIQRRPQRSHTSMRSSGSSLRVDGAPSDPSQLPQALTECYAPEDFDEASTLLICNFPPGCHPFTARNYITWWGPVIRIERAPSVSQEANFVVVFAAPDFAEKVLNCGPIIYEDGKTMLYSRRVDPRVTVWRKLSTYWSGLVG